MTTVEVIPNKPDPEAAAADPEAALSAGFVRDHFAIIVVSIIFTMLLLCYMVEIHWTANDAILRWLEAKMDMVLGAIMMGLTGLGVAAARGLGRK